MAAADPPPSPPVRFGILGCANIARKVSRAILLSPNSTIVAIGSRSAEKAAAFAKDNGFPESTKTYGSYDAVLEDPDVEAVYIPLPTSLHLHWAVLTAKKKKHILLDKPVALNVGELDEILAACEASGVQYMDATMWMHHPRTAEMKAFLSDEQRLGKLKAVHSIFSYNCGGAEFLKNDIRVKPDLDALGALGDTGWYCIRAILWACDYQLPKTVTALRDAEFNESGVILSCGASLLFPDGKLATFYCSFLSNLTMEISVLGENGFLRVHDFVIPFNENVGPFYTNSKTKFSELSIGIEPSPSECLVKTELPQEALMVKEFSSLVKKIKDGLGSEKKWGVISRKTQVVVDAVKASIEKGFEPVEVVYQ
ncbi:Dimeric dihydrodiol dehydrogenase [Handroanthus impetiginosus]|uniref:Dimeric dihydrodiol dehydrogenase n=1 Tax=Handroanthus impetiginosus TaxID=429701 RepID=A0A2G9G2X6_9LAMI|nr:Dimeric dihydrodiol dehydrogenase [Handroanthus impetiginosus]